MSSGRLDARFVWTWYPTRNADARQRQRQQQRQRRVPVGGQTHIGDDLPGAARADVFLPTKEKKKKYGWSITRCGLCGGR